MVPQSIRGLAEVVDQYDAFLVDQFGVLRDGHRPYPFAASTLQHLKDAGKQVVLLSNSGKRSKENDERLVGLGFNRGSWDLFLTSGEVAYEIMRDEFLPSHGRSKQCLLISRDNDLSPVAGLDIELTRDGAAARFVLIAGSEAEKVSLSDYESLLRPAAERGVACLCTNPDRHMLTKQGLMFGAGQIAELYQSMGGPVRYIGKPYPDIYQHALRFLGNPDAKRVCAIGDSVEHDISGAGNAGIQSILVTTGILERATDSERALLFAEHEATPNFILPKFEW